MARRNDARLGRNSTQAPTFAIVFTDFIIIMTYVTLMVACFGFTAWSWIYGPPAQAADPAGVIPYEQTEKGFVVTGGGIMTYPAPEEKAPHQQMLPTAGLHNSQGDRVREISESRPAYEHSDFTSESNATSPMVNGSDCTAHSELGAQQPSGSSTKINLVNSSHGPNGSNNTRLQGPSLTDLPCNSSALAGVAQGSACAATVNLTHQPSQPPFSGTATAKVHAPSGRDFVPYLFATYLVTYLSSQAMGDTALPPSNGQLVPAELATLRSILTHMDNTATAMQRKADVVMIPNDRITALTSRLQACTASLATANSVLEVSQALAHLVQASLDAYTNLDLSLEERITVAEIGFKQRLDTVQQLRAQVDNGLRSAAHQHANLKSRLEQLVC